MSKKLIGVDLGGTHTRAAMAETATSHGKRVERPTPSGETAEKVIATGVAAILEACGGDRPDGVAVGIAGPLNPKTGVVFEAPNVGDWNNIDAGKKFSDALECPVAIHNDAKLAGYAEWVAGAGVGTENMIYVTIGTGIGSAMIFDGELYGGAVGASGELGHLYAGGDSICAMGHRGCLEPMASGTGIGRQAREAIARGEKSSMCSLGIEQVNGQAVNDAAKDGDPLACQIIRGAGLVLGRAISSLINILNPEVVVIGGGVMEAGKLFFDPIHEVIADSTVAVSAASCRVVPAGLGPDAGLVGACAWAWKNFA